LYFVQHGIAPCPLHQLIVSAILNNTPAFDSDDTIGMPNGRETMRND